MGRNLTFAAFALVAFLVSAFPVSAQTFDDLRAKMLDGTAYFRVARTIRKSFGYTSGDALMAVGIGCPVEEAHKTGGYDLDNLEAAAVPIGVTCASAKEPTANNARSHLAARIEGG
jgi:predicted transcriptional regulator